MVNARCCALHPQWAPVLRVAAASQRGPGCQARSRQRSLWQGAPGGRPACSPPQLLPTDTPRRHPTTRRRIVAARDVWDALSVGEFLVALGSTCADSQLLGWAAFVCMHYSVCLGRCCFCRTCSCCVDTAARCCVCGRSPACGNDATALGPTGASPPRPCLQAPGGLGAHHGAAEP